MSSMGFFSTGVDSSIIVRLNLVSPLAYVPRKYVNVGCFNNSDSATLSRGIFSRISLPNGCGGGDRLCRTTPILQATADDTGVEGTDDETEYALQATIEQSKKVIARQRDLLRQIAERKKVVSAIKNSMIDAEFDEQPTADSDITLDNVGSTATEDGTGLGDENRTCSAEAKAKEVQHVAYKSYVKPSPEPSSSSGFYKELKNTTDTIVSPSKTSVDQDLNKNLRNATSKKTILSEVSLTKKYEQEEDLKESGLENGDFSVQDLKIEDVKLPPLAGANAMNIILVAVECSPWIKTGGLGDVAGALPKALARRGHRVMVVVPRYSNYADAQDLGIRRRYKVDGQDMEVNYFHAYIDGVDFVFIDSPIFRHIENDIYAGKRVDILKRMVLFCKAAIEVPWYVPCGGICYGDGNLAFIANDWHTALLPVYLKAYYRDNGLMQYTRSVLVIHNIAHQGRGPADEFACLDLPPHYMELFKLYDPFGGDHMNIFAAGIKTADRIVTVSHGYAWEIKTSEGGWGLHGIMNENDWKLSGIVNGIDTEDWSPDSDIHLRSDGYVNYSLDTLQVGKSQCKAALQRELGLPVRADVPLIGFIGRLDHQKGVDVIGGAIPWMMEQDVQLVMLGTGRPDLEDMLMHFEGQYRDRIRGWVGFSVRTAHRITAGADIILMPSRFEPCGLNQLYAMRYGTVPVVHAVGGLRDTVHPFNPFEESGLGWTFPRAEAHELVNALGYCFLTYRHHRMSWEALQKRGMMQDLSWDNAAQKYEEVLVTAKYQW